jgi:hypothetical protein
MNTNNKERSFIDKHFHTNNDKGVIVTMNVLFKRLDVAFRRDLMSSMSHLGKKEIWFKVLKNPCHQHTLFGPSH